MPNITIDQTGCRACNLCVEICPTKVLEMDAAGDYAKAIRQDDCIGCTSCMYICPSRCLAVTDYVAQRPFHRIELNRAIISKFLQKEPLTDALTDADYDEALHDVATRLSALAESIVETVGRGQKALGRQAGQLAAIHLPEIYECKTLEEILGSLQLRFQHAFPFVPKASNGGESITFTFDHCALKAIVERAGQKEGEAPLCIVFHEYLAGLLGAFAKKRFSIELANPASACELKFLAQ
jgi:NAD-dependent dihydropyrimidine dehydrogenase PreA subunit